MSKSKKGMIDKLKSLKGKTKITFHQSKSNFYDEMNIRRQSVTFQFGEDPYMKSAEGISKNI